MATDPRSYRRYRKLRDEFFIFCLSNKLPCWICSQEIDYAAALNDRRNRSRWQLDHFNPVADYPELAFEWSNFRPSHAGCNMKRGKGFEIVDLGSLSRDWTKPF